MKPFPLTFLWSRPLAAALIAALCLCTAGKAAELSLADVQKKAQAIDKLVSDKLAKEKIQANAAITDEVFVRRIYLDISGRIPTLKETNTFLADTTADKRSKLIDGLLASDGYTQNFFNFWADVLRLKTQGGGNQSVAAGYAYANWLKDALKSNKPYDQMVREMLTADGKTYEDGAVGYYLRDYNMPLDNMAVTTQIFLGTSMVCAQCHDHPFDKWSQIDYYKMAAHSYGMTATNGLSNPLLAQAFYGKGKTNKRGQPAIAANLPAGLQRKDVAKAMGEILRPLRYNTVVDQTDKKPLRLPNDYRYKDAQPQQVIEPVIPASFSKDGKIVKEGEKPIDAYAKWMASKENPRFTTVIANRLWKKVMGMGVIEPVDEITDSTVPANPQLMTFLEDTMKQLNYDMKEYLRVVFNSQTYQRAAYTKDVQLGETYQFPGPLLRRMSAEQIWDSMVTLYRPAPDAASIDARVDREIAIRRIEWLDRSLNALTAEELAKGAAEIAQLQKQLAADVRKAQEEMTEASKRKDEAAIRAAKKVVSTQRKRIDQAAEDIIYTMGFKKFTELAREGKLKEQIDDVEFAKEISEVIKGKEGQDLTIEDALNIVARQQRTRLTDAQKARMQKDAEQLKVDEPKEREALRTWENLRNVTMVRAADLRAPAPNGHFLREFGQSDRELVGNANDEANIGQALMLLNGKTFTQLMNPYTMISRAMSRATSADQAIDAIYLSLFSRSASEDEKKLLRPVVESNANTGKGDALWTALNTRQFYFIE